MARRGSRASTARAKGRGRGRGRKTRRSREPTPPPEKSSHPVSKMFEGNPSRDTEKEFIPKEKAIKSTATNASFSTDHQEFGSVSDLEGIEYQNIHGYRIPTHLADTFCSIYSLCNDIFKNSPIQTMDVRSFFMVQMCKMVKQIRATNYENICEAMITTWEDVCSEHRSVKMDNEWIIRLIKELKSCFKEKMEVLKLENSVKEKVENVSRNIGVDMENAKIGGDILKDCFLVSKVSQKFFVDGMHEMVQQIQATNYENISETMITQWHEVCLDQKTVQMATEWLLSKVEELQNCLRQKMEVLKFENSVKEKIVSVIRERLDDGPLSSNKRKFVDEDVDEGNLVI